MVDRDFVKNSNLSEDEISFMNHLSGKPTTFAPLEYWESDYGININKTRNKLLKNNWLRIATYHESLGLYKATEIRQFLKEHNIKTSRKKSEMVDSLISNFSDKQLKKTFNQEFYIITEKGETINRILTADICDDDLSDGEFDSLCAYLDEKISDLQKQAKSLLLDKDWGLYRNALYEISECYNKKQEYPSQIAYLCAVLYIDLSGMENGNSISATPYTKLAPGVLYNLMDARQALKLSNESLKSFYIKCVSSIKLPHSFYSPDESWRIIEKQYMEYG